MLTKSPARAARHAEAAAGPRLRSLRQSEGLSQGDLAKAMGISASYLNLIEHGRRRLSTELVARAADSLDVSHQDLSGTAEAALLIELAEIFRDPRLRPFRLSRETLTALVASAPDLGRAIVALYKAYRSARDELHGHSERLANDPYLAQSSHQLLTLLTSIHSFAEILHDNADLATAKRQQFVAVLVAESVRLTAQVNHLFEFIRGEDMTGARPADDPWEEVSDLLQAQRNFFPDLESAAEALTRRFGLQPNAPAAQLAERVQRQLGVEIATAIEVTHFDLPESSKRFRLLRLAAAAVVREVLGDLVAQASVSNEKTRRLYRRALENYVAAAVIMPYAEFQSAAQEQRYDIDALCRRFSVSFEQACHRLTSLHRPGAEGLPFHFLRIDIAGNLSKRFSASGLRFTRFAGLCPRWNIHSAFLTPGQISRQVSVMDDGSTYFNMARTVSKVAVSYGAPISHYSVMLGCEISFAPRLVYAEGLELGVATNAVPVGLHCRLCERQDCDQRAFPALGL